MTNVLPFTFEGYNRAKRILVGKYGKPSEVANAHIQSVMALPTINKTNPYKIRDFYKRVIAHINTLDAMGKLKEINGYVWFKLHMLCGIRADLVRIDDNCKTGHLMRWLKQYINGLKETLLRDRKDQTDHSRNNTEESMSCRLVKTRKQENASIAEAKIINQAIACNIIQDVNERRKIISSNGLCFNCIGESQRSCMKCKGHYHTSLCMDETKQKSPTKRTGSNNTATGRNSLPHQRVKLSTRLLWLRWTVLLAEPYWLLVLGARTYHRL